MKNFTFAIATAALALSAASNAQTLSNSVTLPQHAKEAFLKLAKAQKAVRNSTKAAKAMSALREAASELWMPTHDTEYSYDDGEWSKEAENTYTYSNTGLTMSQVQYSYGDYTKLENTYNDKGQIVEQHMFTSEDGTNYTEMVKRMQEYDERTGTVTKYEAFSYDTDTNEWVRSRGTNKREIVRNADGNITSCTYYSLNSDGETWDEVNKLTFTYDAGSSAPTKCVYTEEGLTVTYSDMKWTKCNGQLTEELGEAWVSADNVLKSTHMEEVEDGDSVEYNITASAEDNGDFHYLIKLPAYNYLMLAMYKKTTDDNGSFKAGLSTYFNNTGGEVTYDDKYLVSEDQYTTCTFDAQGNLTLQEEYAADETTGTPTLTDGTKYEYKYDGSHGEMTESVQYSYNSSSSEYEPYTKIEYSDFTNVAGTNGIHSVENMNGGVAEFYNLQGMKMNNAAQKGIYIMKQNGKTVKVMK